MVFVFGGLRIKGMPVTAVSRESSCFLSRESSPNYSCAAISQMQTVRQETGPPWVQHGGYLPSEASLSPFTLGQHDSSELNEC